MRFLIGLAVLVLFPIFSGIFYYKRQVKVRGNQTKRQIKRKSFAIGFIMFLLLLSAELMIVIN